MPASLIGTDEATVIPFPKLKSSGKSFKVISVPSGLIQESLKVTCIVEESNTSDSNSFISSTLKAEALKQGDITFNHQTAWGKKEFLDLLRSHKFFVRTYMNTKDILKEYNFIPGITAMEEISLFVSCYKT